VKIIDRYVGGQLLLTTTLAVTVLSLAVAVVYFFFIIIGNSVRENPRWHPEILMWVPNVLCMGFGGWLFLRMSRR